MAVLPCRQYTYLGLILHGWWANRLRLGTGKALAQLELRGAWSSLVRYILGINADFNQGQDCNQLFMQFWGSGLHVIATCTFLLRDEQLLISPFK